MPSLSNVSTTGRLRRFFIQWSDITTDRTVLEVIRNYRIPFTSVLSPRTSLREMEFPQFIAKFCDLEVKRLLLKGAIKQAESCADQFLSSFFLVDKSLEDKRFILNLRELNTYIKSPHFKLKDWRTVIRLMLPGSYMATFKDAYLLPIDEHHRKYLRFQWRGMTYEFTALSFGLSTAPFIFYL